MIDVDVISRYLPVITGGKFEQGEVGRYPVNSERVMWFLWKKDGQGAHKTPYIHVVWIEPDGILHIETERLGNTSDITEWIYGEKSLYEFAKMDLTDFERPEVRAEYANRFPKVVGRLETYKKFAEKESVKHGVRIELLFNGTKGLADFRLQATFGTSDMDTPLVLHEIDRSIAALKRVYYEIAERQEQLYWIWALPANRKGTPEETKE